MQKEALNKWEIKEEQYEHEILNPLTRSNQLTTQKPLTGGSSSKTSFVLKRGAQNHSSTRPFASLLAKAEQQDITPIQVIKLKNQAPSPSIPVISLTSDPKKSADKLRSKVIKGAVNIQSLNSRLYYQHLKQIIPGFDTTPLAHPPERQQASLVSSQFLQLEAQNSTPNLNKNGEGQYSPNLKKVLSSTTNTNFYSASDTSLRRKKVFTSQMHTRNHASPTLTNSAVNTAGDLLVRQNPTTIFSMESLKLIADKIMPSQENQTIKFRSHSSALPRETLHNKKYSQLYRVATEKQKAINEALKKIPRRKRKKILPTIRLELPEQIAAKNLNKPDEGPLISPLKSDRRIHNFRIDDIRSSPTKDSPHQPSSRSPTKISSAKPDFFSAKSENKVNQQAIIRILRERRQALNIQKLKKFNFFNTQQDDF